MRMRIGNGNGCKKEEQEQEQEGERGQAVGMRLLLYEGDSCRPKDDEPQ